MSLAELTALSAPRAAPRAPARAVVAVLTAICAASILLAYSVSVEMAHWPVLVSLPLVALSAIWIAGGAATAMLGLCLPARASAGPPPGWRPVPRTAILVTLCGEAPGPLAHAMGGLRAGLDRLGMADATTIFVLSDTTDPAQAAREAAIFDPWQGRGALRYRRRGHNTGRKPGNIAEWLAEHGGDFDLMLVLDADSRMTPARIARMIWQMQTEPRLGLLQAGIALVPGRTRFGRHQRVAARLLSQNFGHGFAAWSGDSGNYWGHNAILRVAAFRAAAALPRLPGAAPFGGDLLSHDFVEAAWIRRAGWAVRLDPDARGSAEDAPQTLAAFHRRDRRWCQGNLQHLALLAEPGLDPVSRIHLAAGILGYLVAPLWLGLVALIAAGGAGFSGALPLLTVLAVLAVPKLCALAHWLRRARTRGRRAIVLRACLGEVAVSSLIAPLILLRQAASVAAVVVLRRDCGWKSGVERRPWPRGLGEALTGVALAAAAVSGLGEAALWLAPVILPLLAAPLIVRALDAPA